MDGFSFPGNFEDAHGEEQITWRIEPSRRQGLPGYELHTTIRGQAVWGYDFDGLEPVDPAAAHRAALPINQADELEGTLSGNLPCTLRDPAGPTRGIVRFRLELPSPRVPAPRNLLLTTTFHGKVYEVADEWFESGIQRLDELLHPEAGLICCFTCLLSDYSPGGHGLMGMSCHRDSKPQYLAVRSKADYWGVPVTEKVMETYLCSEYEPRMAGTGYRG